MDGNVSTTGRPSEPASRRILCATRMDRGRLRDRSARQVMSPDQRPDDPERECHGVDHGAAPTVTRAPSTSAAEPSVLGEPARAKASGTSSSRKGA
jgi:hypothetical protein